MSERPESAFERWGYKLPIGFYINDFHVDSFELGPVRGSLRRQLANLMGRTEPWTSLEVLKHCVMSLGDGLGPPSSDLLRRLPSPDVEYILYVIACREMPQVPLDELVCQELHGSGVCGQELSGEVALQGVGVVEATAEVAFVGGDPTILKQFHDPIEDRSISVRYRVSNLGDEIQMMDDLSNAISPDGHITTMGNLTFSQHAATMVDYDDRGAGLTTAELDELHYKTVTALTETLDDVHPASVDTDVKVRCPRCRGVNEAQLPLKRWLRPLAPGKTEAASAS